MENVEKIALSPEEAAARLGLSRTFIYAEMKDGKIATAKIGRRRLIPVSEVDAYLHRHVQAAA